MKLTIQDALGKDKSQYPHALLRSIPPKLCFLFSLRPVPPWVSLQCAWGKVKHLPLSWSKPVQVSTFNISFLLFRYNWFFSPSEPSLCAWNINEPLWLSWGEQCSDSLLLCSASCCFSLLFKRMLKGWSPGVCDAESEPGTSGSWNKKKWRTQSD